METENRNLFLGLWLNPWKAAFYYWKGITQYMAESFDLALAVAEPSQRMQAKILPRAVIPPARAWWEAVKIRKCWAMKIKQMTGAFGQDGGRGSLLLEHCLFSSFGCLGKRKTL